MRPALKRPRFRWRRWPRTSTLTTINHREYVFPVLPRTLHVINGSLDGNSTLAQQLIRHGGRASLHRPLQLALAALRRLPRHDHRDGLTGVLGLRARHG